MRVAVISTPVFALGPQGALGYSGLEHLAWQQAKGLAAKGHQVTLFAPDGSTCPGAEVFPFGPPGHGDERATYTRYWQELSKFDCVIDNTWCKWAYCLKAEGRLKAPVLAVLHAPVNTMYQVWPPRFPGLPEVEKACPVCISMDQGHHFEALHGRQVRVAYNGVDLDFYKPLGVKRSGRFLFLARFSSIKGPHLAIEACRKAGAGLDLVGDTSITNEPDYLARCKKAADDTFHQDATWSVRNDTALRQIALVGPASRGECVHWFSQAHALIHPTKHFREPFGLAPVEAMACGTPVIAWNYGALRETIKLGLGWLVSSEEDLVQAVRDASEACKYTQIRTECREWAGEFSVQKMVNRYSELCEEAIEQGW